MLKQKTRLMNVLALTMVVVFALGLGAVILMLFLS